MQFIRNTLLIGAKAGFQMDLEKSLSSISKKMNVEIISDKNELSAKLAEKTINSVFINLPEISDCLYIFRLLGMYKMKTNDNDKNSLLMHNSIVDTVRIVVCQ